MERDRTYIRGVGERITQLRKQHQMTQAELARILGVSQQTVFAIELGDRRVSIDRLPALVRMLGTSADALLGIIPLPQPSKARLSPRFIRHVGHVQQLSAMDQRLILRLAEVLTLVHR